MSHLAQIFYVSRFREVSINCFPFAHKNIVNSIILEYLISYTIDLYFLDKRNQVIP